MHFFWLQTVYFIFRYNQVKTMTSPNELNEYEYKTKKPYFKDAPITSTRLYIKRLTNLQIFSICIIFLAAALQAIAIGTNDWFVLNVNEYIPTSKGGLWNYCYIATNGYIGQFTCLKYEELPNYAIFINSRLYDSRVLLLCSCGFCFLLMVIEIFGILCLCLAETRGDLIDSFVARRSARFRMEKQRPTELMYPSSPRVKSKSQNSSKIVGNNDETTNSARFTTSIIVNANPEQAEYYQTIKPTGYFAFLAIALITLVGSVMDFVLKVSGFALFDAYISRLLQFNTVFIAYRSYSYWMMVVSIALIFFFWLFKIFSTRYVINLTKKLIKERETFNEIVLPSICNNPQSASQCEPFKTSNFCFKK